jgi:cobalt-zinc-cadmium efflux system membrane fusion protein
MKPIQNTIAIALITLLIAGCKQAPEQEITQNEGPQIALTDEQMQRSGIAVGPLTMRDMPQTISCSGVIDVPPGNRASITTAYGGYITYTDIYPGEVVKKGQLLAQLKDPLYVDLQRSYLEAKSKLTYLEADYTRKSALHKNESVSEKAYQQAQRDVEAVRVEVEALKAQLKIAGIKPSVIENKGVQDKVDVRAPIHGYVTSVNINLGAHVEPGDALFELIDPSHLHIELNAYPNDLGKLKIGQTVLYTIVGDDSVQTGEIYLINKAVNNTTRSIVIHVHPDDEEAENHLPGTFVQAKIVYSNQRKPVIPVTGIVQTAEGYIAYRKVAGGFEEILFEAGKQSDGFLDASTLPKGEYVLAGAKKVANAAPDHSH